MRIWHQMTHMTSIYDISRFCRSWCLKKRLDHSNLTHCSDFVKKIVLKFKNSKMCSECFSFINFEDPLYFCVKNYQAKFNFFLQKSIVKIWCWPLPHSNLNNIWKLNCIYVNLCSGKIKVGRQRIQIGSWTQSLGGYYYSPMTVSTLLFSFQTKTNQVVELLRFYAITKLE